MKYELQGPDHAVIREGETDLLIEGSPAPTFIFEDGVLYQLSGDRGDGSPVYRITLYTMIDLTPKPRVQQPSPEISTLGAQYLRLGKKRLLDRIRNVAPEDHTERVAADLLRLAGSVTSLDQTKGQG